MSHKALVSCTGVSLVGNGASQKSMDAAHVLKRGAG